VGLVGGLYESSDEPTSHVVVAGAAFSFMLKLSSPSLEEDVGQLSNKPAGGVVSLLGSLRIQQAVDVYGEVDCGQGVQRLSCVRRFQVGVDIGKVGANRRFVRAHDIRCHSPAFGNEFEACFGFSLLRHSLPLDTGAW
jgi:hypothetical protein